MKKALYFLLCIFISFQSVNGQISLKDPLCENLKDPIGLDVLNPRFSWKLLADKDQRNVTQTAYELKVAENRKNLLNGKNLVWSTGKIASDASVFVSYDGPELKSGYTYFWQVRAWDNNGKRSKWSEVGSWKMGLLSESDWKALWIGPGYEEEKENRPSPYLRKEFQSTKPVRSATAYITARGMYEARINGERVGDACLTPGWTVYQKRLQYQVYDVTSMIKTGQNAIGVTLGSGWHRGYIGFRGNKEFYGNDVSLLLQVEIEYTDGTREWILSDGTWKSSTGAIRGSEIYNGETIDARLEQVGWDNPGFDDTGWVAVSVRDYGYEKLVATYNETIKKQEIFQPKSIFKSPKGEHIIDFGQNLVGWVVVKANGAPGDQIIIEHAEVLDKEGNFYTENLRSADQKNTYILKGGGEEIFEPHFTFQGFRYIKVEGYPGELNKENFTAVALYSDMQETGKFECSDPLINQLQHNIQWGQKGNFLDVPTDCPQRDERLGWTGDAQVFSRTASFNMQVHNFFSKWLRDLAADQELSDGCVPYVVPNVLSESACGATGWADAATIIPWNMYLAYGDLNILDAQYESMKSWVQYMEERSKDYLWNTGFHYGDWLFYRPDDDNSGRAAVTSKYLIAQTFFANSLQILIDAGKLLGRNNDVSRYENLLAKVKEAFMNEYVTPNGNLTSETQTAFVLALQFDMLPESLREQAAERLVRNIESYDHHLTTGFLGTPYLCHVLTRFGYEEVAYKLLHQETYPSWLYPVKMGATTIWERWDGIKPDSTFQTPNMNSYNHYAYGAIGDWMYRAVAGLDTYTESPGYKHIRIKPHIGGRLSSANAALKTYYGNAVSGWQMDKDGNIVLQVEIPCNTRATIFVPGNEDFEILEGEIPVSDNQEIISKGWENGYSKVEVGSGKYIFKSKIDKAF